MTTTPSVVIIEAGQAGLSVSRQLTTFGADHVVLERGRIAETWRGLWDSFCLVTPNWPMCLPDAPYAGDDPEGFDLCTGAFERPHRPAVAAASVAGSVARYQSRPGK